MTVPTYMRK